MTGLVLIGAGKFAVEVARYVEDIAAAGAPDHHVDRYLAVEGEEVHAPAGRVVPAADWAPPAGARVVVALSDPVSRVSAIQDVVQKHGLAAENLVHPTSLVDAARIGGTGNIVGPHCYVGVNVTLGSFNVVNYHSTIGHHSRIGSNNFVAPNFHCGNSVEIGDNNFFGLSCTLAPELIVGSDNRFQAGLSLFENCGSGLSHLSPSRIKSIPSS